MSCEIVGDAMKIAFANWVIVSYSDEVQSFVDGLCWSLLCKEHGDVIDEIDRDAINFSCQVRSADSGYVVQFVGTLKISQEQLDAIKSCLGLLIEYLGRCFALWEKSAENTELHKVLVMFDWSIINEFDVTP